MCSRLKTVSETVPLQNQVLFFANLIINTSMIFLRIKLKLKINGYGYIWREKYVSRKEMRF